MVAAVYPVRSVCLKTSSTTSIPIRAVENIALAAVVPNWDVINAIRTESAWRNASIAVPNVPFSTPIVADTSLANLSLYTPTPLSDSTSILFSISFKSDFLINLATWPAAPRVLPASERSDKNTYPNSSLVSP